MVVADFFCNGQDFCITLYSRPNNSEDALIPSNMQLLQCFLGWVEEKVTVLLDLALVKFERQ